MSRSGPRRGIKRFWRRFARNFSGDGRRQNPWLYVLSAARPSSAGILNLVGYALLLSSAIDYTVIFFEPQFTDPAWELRAFGAAITNIWAVFIALGFVFFRQPNTYIRRFELRILGAIRWLCLLLAIVLLLAIPLGLRNTLTLDRRTTQQVQTQQAQRQQQFDAARQQLQGDLSDAQLDRLATVFRLSPEADVRGEALDRVRQEEQSFNATLAERRGDARRTLLQTSARANLGAVVAATVAFLIWRSTRWISRTLQQEGSQKPSTGAHSGPADTPETTLEPASPAATEPEPTAPEEEV